MISKRGTVSETSISNACCESSVKAKYKMPGLGDRASGQALCRMPPSPPCDKIYKTDHFNHFKLFNSVALSFYTMLWRMYLLSSFEDESDVDMHTHPVNRAPPLVSQSPGTGHRPPWNNSPHMAVCDRQGPRLSLKTP